MKNKYILALIATLLAANSAFAAYQYDESSFYTGDSLFQSSKFIEKVDDTNTAENDTAQENKEIRGTIPPLKKMRLSIQKMSKEREERKHQLAPTDPDASIYKSETETSDFVSKEVEEKFDENMMPDGFDADEEAVEENKKAKHFWRKNKTEKVAKDEDTENIVLDCDNMDYDTENYCLYATGNVNVLFVKQETAVKADKITYDRMNNTIKAEGNVHIIKNGQTIDGDYIFVDMNEENALIENPITKTDTIEIRSKKGYVYGDKIIQEQGSIIVDESYPIRFHPSGGGPQLYKMINPKEQTISNDMEKGLVKVNARELIITQKGELETLAIKHGNVKKGKYTILKVPAIKIYTNKNHEYGETNIWEVGSLNDFGMYAGPGFVFELPKGSVLKAIPVLNYDHRIGVGVIGRFNSGTNYTQAGYGTAKSKILIRGEQKLDDNLKLKYAMNDYIDEWWMGRRRPKYGLNLVYQNEYSRNGFLLKNLNSSYKHSAQIGYFHDFERDGHFGELMPSHIGTTRAKYMGEAIQTFYHYENEDKQTALSLSLIGHVSAAVYGTGDTQFVGQLGPSLHTQWKRWMQDVSYFQSVYEDHTPMPVFDAYRYGKSNVTVREYFRISKYLTLSWFGSFNLSGDAPNDKMLQENAFYLSIGPSDIKFNVGYDFIRENTFFSVEMMMDAKGTQVDYDKLVIKRDKKPSDDAKESNTSSTKNSSEFKNTEKAPVLEYAQVENIKDYGDVL